MSEVKESKIAIRVTHELREDINEYLGKNASKEVRAIIQSLIQQKKEDLDGLLTCFVCRKKQKLISQMNLGVLVLNDFIPVLCEKCLDSIANRDSGTWKNRELSELEQREVIIRHSISKEDKDLTLDTELLSQIKQGNSMSLNPIELNLRICKKYPTFLSKGYTVFILGKDFQNMTQEHFENEFNLYDWNKKHWKV